MTSNKNKSVNLEWSRLGIDEDEIMPNRAEIKELISAIRTHVSMKLGLMNLIETQPDIAQQSQKIIQMENDEALEQANELFKLIGTDNDILTDQAVHLGISEAQVIVREIELAHVQARSHFEIEKEYNLRKLQMHKQEARGGAEVREDRVVEGRDMTYSWDSMFRKDHQPAFKPQCYTREMNGVKTFIPNVRIIMDAATGYKQPIAHHINWYPDEAYHQFTAPAPIVSERLCKIEEEEIITKFTRVVTGKNSQALNLGKIDPRMPVGMPKENVQHDIPEQDQIIAFTIVKTRKRTDYITEESKTPMRVVYQSKGGIDFKGSKEIGPPAEYNSDGKLLKCWCYASMLGKDAFKYTITGSWAEAMRKRFLSDLHDGAVNICRAIERNGDGKKKTKHQAFRTYSTRIRMRKEDGAMYWMSQNVTLFCDIKMISNNRFANPSDLIDIMRVERSNMLTSDDAAVGPVG